MKKRIVLLSGTEFGWHCLDELLGKHANLVGVFGPDEERLKGISDYKFLGELLQGTGIPFHEIDSINSPQALDLLKSMAPDVLLVMGWQEILRRRALEVPKEGCIGSHPTELPKYRGGAPVAHTILRGLDRTALTFFYLDPGTDTGDIVLQHPFPVARDETATTLTRNIVSVGRAMIRALLPMLESGSVPRRKQDPSQLIEVWRKRKPDDGRIDWTRPVGDVYALIRAVTHPYPGAFTFLGPSKIVIWSARPESYQRDAQPGTIVEVSEEGPMVAAQGGTLLLQQVQGTSHEVPASWYFCSQRYLNLVFS